jgi:hypothetical protein
MEVSGVGFGLAKVSRERCHGRLSFSKVALNKVSFVICHRPAVDKRMTIISIIIHGNNYNHHHATWV